MNVNVNETDTEIENVNVNVVLFVVVVDLVGNDVVVESLQKRFAFLINFISHHGCTHFNFVCARIFYYYNWGFIYYVYLKYLY